MLATLRQRDFALLWFGGLISIMGDWMLLVALPIYVYGLTGSALATGAMFAAGLLPNVILGSVAGVFVDRWDRKRTMVAANLLMAVSLLPLLVAPRRAGCGSSTWWLSPSPAWVSSISQPRTHCCRIWSGQTISLPRTRSTP